MVHATEVQAVTMFQLSPCPCSAPLPLLLCSNSSSAASNRMPSRQPTIDHCPSPYELYILFVCVVLPRRVYGRGTGGGRCVTVVCGFCCVSMALVNFGSAMAAAVTVTGASRCFRLCSCIFFSFLFLFSGFLIIYGLFDCTTMCLYIAGGICNWAGHEQRKEGATPACLVHVGIWQNANTSQGHSFVAAARVF